MQAVDAGSQVNGVIDHLAGKLLVPATQLWGVLLRQAKIEGCIELVFSVILFAGSIMLALLVRYGVRKYKENKYSDWDTGAAFSGAGAVVLFIIMLFVLSSAITDLVNPAYFAAQTILGSVK